MIFDMRIRPPEFLEEVPAHLRNYQMYDMDRRGSPFRQGDRQKWLQEMDEAGITHGLLFAPPWYESVKANEILSSIVGEYPGRFVGAIAIDIDDQVRAVTELERAVKELGLHCLFLRPFLDKAYANDRRYYPLYAKCVELGIPVSVVVGVNFSQEPALEFGRPLYLDQVACDFPQLKILGSHGGWPWVTEMVAVAWRNKNVFIDITSIAPRYVGMPGTGWDPLMIYGNSLLQDRILWGTDWPSLDWKETVSQLKALPLKEEIKEKWLFENAAALFGIL